MAEQKKLKTKQKNKNQTVVKAGALKILVVSGKRKRAIAKARLKAGNGRLNINKIPIDLFQPEVHKLRLQEPFMLAGPIAKNVDVSVSVSGGGVASQVEAARLSIAKGLVKFTRSEDLKRLYLKYDRHMLVADTRRNEPHKPNDSKPRAKRQKSYR